MATDKALPKTTDGGNNVVKSIFTTICTNDFYNDMAVNMRRHVVMQRTIELLALNDGKVFEIFLSKLNLHREAVLNMLDADRRKIYNSDMNIINSIDLQNHYTVHVLHNLSDKSIIIELLYHVIKMYDGIK